MLRGVFGPSKAQLIRQIGSPDNNTALKAVEKLRANGWFRDGSLQGVDLHHANLQKNGAECSPLERGGESAADKLQPNRNGLPAGRWSCYTSLMSANETRLRMVVKPLTIGAG